MNTSALSFKGQVAAQVPSEMRLDMMTTKSTKREGPVYAAARAELSNIKRFKFLT